MKLYLIITIACITFITLCAISPKVVEKEVYILIKTSNCKELPKTGASIPN